MIVSAVKAVGATERWRLEGNSPGLPSRRVAEATTFRGSEPGEAQCLISFLLRYGYVWTDWRTTSSWEGSKEETLDLDQTEDIVAISGYSWDWSGGTISLQAESSEGRRWGPFGRHELCRYKTGAGTGLRASPQGLRLNHISGDQTHCKYILRWLLHQYNQMKI